MKTQFCALVVREHEGIFSSNVETVSMSDLPQNELLIKVKYSTVNFKDALSASGNKGVTQKFPHVPGVDAVGEVISSTSDKFKEGDNVIVTGFDFGMNTWGGYGQYVSVPASWVVLLPEKLSPLEAMSYGTAGLTAGMCVDILIQAGITPQSGKIAVSGATGGVGSISIAILSKLGYQVVAISGKEENEFLTKTLGASSVISRNDFVKEHDSHDLSETIFAGAIDATGGNILSGILKSLNYNGTVTACGMVASLDLNTSILPFILRGVKLIGIDSVQQPSENKDKIWQLLADQWKPAVLQELITEIGLEQLPEVLNRVLDGKAVGRYVVQHM